MTTENLSHLGFRAWDLTAGHDQLVLRHPGIFRGEENIDIWFGGVMYLEIAHSFAGLEFSSPTEHERNYLASRCELSSEQVMYVLVSKGRRYYVVAAGMTISRNRYPIWMTSISRRWGPGTSEFRHRVKQRHLVHLHPHRESSVE